MSEDVLPKESGRLERLSPEVKLAVSLIPFLGPAFTKYIDDVVERRRKKLRTIEKEFTQASGEDIAALFERSTADPRFGDLLTQTIDEAQRTASERKLRALGRLLALGFDDDEPEHLDEIELMFLAVADLESAHIRVLDLLVRRGTRHGGVGDYQIASLFPNGTTVAYPILKTLERHGMAGPQSPPSADPDQVIKWVPWDFGIYVHQKLLAEGTS
ncbi:hypothetical protein [Catenulispora rubra]|uniref:hypothetical protein n=1 Tax=Catenulispora rubra TaxID=280293 RepID=UPI0018924B7D|nr:hypothetical protein [Catenulispora rubra]